MQFAAIDVETANADLSSICQVGVAIFKDGVHVSSWASLVDPEDDFDGFNVAIHGIDEKCVAGSPKWPHVAGEIRRLLSGSVVACHTPFDRAATGLACEKYRLGQFDFRWLDTARVVRRAWPDKFATTGYGLRNVAHFLGIAFKHHDAAEDARAAGEVLCRASAHVGLNIDEWCARVRRPIDPTSTRLTRDGYAEGPLFGNVAVLPDLSRSRVRRPLIWQQKLDVMCVPLLRRRQHCLLSVIKMCRN